MVYSIEPGALPYWIKLKAVPGDVAYYYDKSLERYYICVYDGPAAPPTYQMVGDYEALVEYLAKHYNYKVELDASVEKRASKYYVEPALMCTAKPIPDIGDTIYYCYELFGEHLIQEVIVEELTINRNGLKSIRVKSINGNSSYVFEVGSAYYSLDELAFTKEDADRWLGEKR